MASARAQDDSMITITSSSTVHSRGEHCFQGVCRLPDARSTCMVARYCKRESHGLPHSFRRLASGFGGTELVGNDKDARAGLVAEDSEWWTTGPPRPCV